MRDFELKYLKDLVPYKTVSQEAWKNRENKNVLKLDWNESTVPPSPMVKEAIMLATHLNWYPEVNNIELYDRLSDYVGRPKSNIQYFGSSDSLHEYIGASFIGQDDEVLIFGPTYDNFRAVAASNGARITIVNLSISEHSFYDDFADHIRAIQPKIVYIVTPNNPTGLSVDSSVLQALITDFSSTLFVIDEAYFEFCSKSVAHLCESQNLIVCRTFSKAFGLASFRIGYCIAHKNLLNVLNKVRNPKSVSQLAQVAALACLKDIQYMKDYVEEVKLAKVKFLEFLKGVKWLGSGHSEANFLFIDAGATKSEIVDFLALKNIYVRDYGHINGCENYFRITIGTLQQMSRVMAAIEEFESQYFKG